MRPLLAFLLAVSPTVALANGRNEPVSWNKLSFQPSTRETWTASTPDWSFKLGAPDDASHPRVWDSAVEITDKRRGSTCKLNTSLVTDVFASPAGPYAITFSYSGERSDVDFWALNGCKKLHRLSAYTENIRIEDARLIIAPGCECAEANTPCSCSAAKIYRIRPGQAPSFQRLASERLTKAVLGVAFTGNRNVLAPKTSRAQLAPDRRGRSK